MKTKDKRLQNISLTNCSFTGTPTAIEAVAAVTALARAAEQNAVAIQLAAKLLAGPDALLKIGAP